MKGCNECVHYKSGLGDKLNLVHTCKMHNDKKMLEWWDRNGKKTGGKLDEMDCYEFPEHIKILEKLSKTASEIHSKIR